MGPASLRASVLGWHHASRAWQRRSPHGWTCRRVQVGMAVRDRALNPTGAGSGAFLHLWSEPDPHRTRFGCGFHFSPVGAPETRKKLKTQKKPEKPERNPKTPERNSFTKSDGHSNPTQNPTGSGAKFHPWVRVRCQIQPDYIFHGSDFRSTRPEPNQLSSLGAGRGLYASCLHHWSAWVFF
jgi:hypothetical protein